MGAFWWIGGFCAGVGLSEEVLAFTQHVLVYFS